MKTYPYPISHSGKVDGETQNNIQALCQKMVIDLEEGKQLSETFPERFRFVTYEDLYSNDASVIALHSFIGMKITKHDLSKIRGRISNVVKGMENSARVQRTQNNAFWWRSYMSWDVVQKVNKYCDDVLRALGYEVIENETELRQFNKTVLLENIVYKML